MGTLPLQAIIDDLATLRMPSPEIANWFRSSPEAAFADVEELHKRHSEMLAKRMTELVNMQDRLLNCYRLGSPTKEPCDFHLDAGGTLPEKTLPDNAVKMQYVKKRQGAPRPDDGKIDIGAFEYVRPH